MKQPLETIFRENLRFYRQRKKISQEKLSELLNKNINYINMIEGGKSVPPLSVIEQIANILEIEPHCLLELIEKSPSLDKAVFVQKAVEEISVSVRTILSRLLE